MDDDSHVIDKGWDALPDYAKSGDADDAPTVSISTTPGEWLVNTTESVVVPMSMVEVVEALRHRKLTERSLVWRAGMQEWAPIDKVPQLKLAIRHAPSDLAAAQSAAGSSGPANDALSGRASSKPPPVRPSQPAHAQPAGLSRRSTLPFGLPNPNATARPSQPRLASPTAAPAPPPPPREEPEVLAVYARPAATISFDLSPSEPARVPAAAAPPGPPPQTLAPTTSDARRPARVLSPRSSADLSVVAASQFREVQRSSKRLLWVSSLASAAAASVLTLWVSGAAPWARPAAAPSKRAPQAEPAVAARLQPAAPAPAPAEPSPPPASVAAPPSAAAAAASIEPSPKAIAAVAKPAARKARAVSMAPASQPKAVPASQPKAVPAQPSSEPNPYEVKLDDETGQPPAKPAARGLLDMIQESEQKAAEVKPPEASATSSSSSPGF
jgi:hypothetical protein